MAEIICPQCKAANKDTGRFCSECGASLLGASPRASDLRTSTPSMEIGLLLQDRYRIVKELGRGGFGAVYRAWDSRLNKPVALKENMESSSEAQRQFTREALVLANLSHPNLPRVTDHFSIPKHGQYLVMDFVEGEDLETLVRRQEMIPVEQALTWIMQVLDALEYLHGQNPPVFHRDIKPANVRITPQGQAMLVDFGLVKVSAPNLKTTMGARAISPGYAPPEQYGHGRTDARTDIYALAATLYRLVTGQEPPESVQRIAGDVMSTASQLNPQIPGQVSQAIERGMALEPERRFSNASELRTTLKQGMTAFQDQGSKISVVGISPSLLTQPAIEAPVQPISKLPSQEEGLRTKVEDISPNQQLRTQVVSEIPSTSGQISGMRASSTTEFQENLPGMGRIPFIPQAKKAIPRWIIFAGIGGIVILFMMCAIIAVFALSGGIDSSKTATAEIKSTMEARIQSTQTQAFVMRESTAEKRASLTARAVSSAIVKTSTAQARSQATEQALTSFLAPLGITSSPKLKYSQSSGSLTHDADEYLELYGPDSKSLNFLLQVQFLNPYSISKGPWDYGVAFRDIGQNQEYRLVISSDKTWYIKKYLGSTTKKTDIANGNIPGLRINENDSNLIRIVVVDTRGWIFVNEAQIGKFALSTSDEPGEIWVGTGFHTDTEILGEVTRYSDFIIWELP